MNYLFMLLTDSSGWRMLDRLEFPPTSNPTKSVCSLAAGSQP
jgi:hypothetical protein